MAQAFGVPTLRKYESDGGPGVQSILALLRESDRPGHDTAAFLKAHMVFWLLAAPDGHAKNFSIHPTPAGFRLAPLYDVMTSIPYAHVREFHPRSVKLAMAIGAGRKWKVDEILPRHWRETVETARLDRDLASRLMADVAARAPAALDEVSRTLPEAVPQAFFEPVAEAVLKRAARLADGH
jgi:serine/threonine-protein kinase HipA